MNFLKHKQHEQSPQFILQQALRNLPHQFSSLKSHFESNLKPKLQQQSPQSLLQQAFTDLQNHLASSLKPHLESTLSTLQNHAKQAIESGVSKSFRVGSGSGKNPVWARIFDQNAPTSVPMSTEDIEERLAGVPVYALSNPSEEFVLIAGVDTGKSLGLFCFREEDAETLLAQMKSMDPGMRQGSKVVAVALSKVFQLKVDGVSFRLIPESSQIKNALKARRNVGSSGENFSGVPVFQSRSLILRSQNKRYRPVFFRKEDLEKSLLRASRDQKQLNPALREGDIQVAALEDIIYGMKTSSTSEWDDVVFIPPGFDVSTDPSQR